MNLIKKLLTHRTFVSVGKVYNCDCTAPLENSHHYLNCASRKNLTLIYYYRVNLWQRFKNYINNKPSQDIYAEAYEDDDDEKTV